MNGLDKRIWGLVLASGSSSRFGERDKRLAHLGSRTMIELTVGAYARALEHVLVVTRPEDRRVREKLSRMSVGHVMNDNAQVGQSASLRSGMAAVSDEVEAVVIGVGDQPLLAASTIHKLIGSWLKDPTPTVAPSYGPQRGNPVLFSSELFSQLQCLTGDVGGRQLLRQHPPRLIAIQPAWTGLDVDTPQDLAVAASYLDHCLDGCLGAWTR